MSPLAPRLALPAAALLGVSAAVLPRVTSAAEPGVAHSATSRPARPAAAHASAAPGVPDTALPVVAGGAARSATSDTGPVPSYRVRSTSAAKDLLLGADEAAWSRAAGIEWGPAAYLTRFRALWSDAGLFLRFDATDPSPWHTMTGRDEHLWDEEVVEIFLDPDRSGRNYYELEVNPANVVCDLRMISPWPDKKGEIEWNLAGLETRVAKGPAGWTATAFLPWAGLRPLPSASSVALPPRPGDAWRFNVFRIERPGGKQQPEKDAVFAAWSPPSEKSFHDAKAFRDLVFEGAPR